MAKKGKAAYKVIVRYARITDFRPSVKVLHRTNDFKDAHMFLQSILSDQPWLKDKLRILEGARKLLL